MKFVANKYLKLKQSPIPDYFCMILFSCAFRILLDVAYVYFVFPQYEYAGFTYSFSALRFVESLAVFLMLLFLLPRKFKKPSDLFVVMFFFGLITPLTSLYGLTENQPAHFYTVLLGYVLVLICRRGKRFRLPVLKQGQKIALFVLALLAIIVTAWLIISGGVHLFSVSLRDVYEYRELSKEAINVGLMSYANAIAFKFVGPCLLAYSLFRKWFIVAVFICLIQVFWFGVSAHKAVLFYPTLVMFIWLFLDRGNSFQMVPLTLFVLVFFSLALFFCFDHRLAPSLFVRRAFFVISHNAFDYFIYFQDEPWVLWSNSITSKYIEYPYSLSPVRLIGEWRGTDSNVNNSFLSMGYMHAGIIGVVLYGVLAGLIFRLIDSLENKSLPAWLIAAALVVPVRAMLLSTDLPTALLTHGLAIGILVVFLLRDGFGTSNALGRDHD